MFGMKYQFEIVVDNITYKVNVEKKRVRNINYRFRNGEFYVSAHPLVSKGRILQGLNKFARELILKSKETIVKSNDFIYILGEKYFYNEDKIISLSNGVIIKYKDESDLEKKLKIYFKELVTERVRYFESIMKTEHYNVRVQKMRSRYGSNSKRTHTLNFSTVLVHYCLEIIDSVVVHELAHYYEFNHSNKFYNVVYKYCPDYNYLHKCLRKGVFYGKTNNK